MKKGIHHWITNPSEFWMTYHPIFNERTAQRDHQGLQYCEEVYVAKDGITRLVHERC